MIVYHGIRTIIYHGEISNHMWGKVLQYNDEVFKFTISY